MKYSAVTALFCAAVSATGPCADNCGRAIIATRFGETGIQARSSDCIDYFRKTVTPDASTVYVTKTIPTYATPCSGEARYKTACACLVGAAETVVAPAPTITSVIYV